MECVLKCIEYCDSSSYCCHPINYYFASAYIRSVDHPSYPVNSRYTRVDHYFSEMVIKPHSFVDELGFDYEVTYFDNPQLRLSSTIVNWVTTAGELSSILNLGLLMIIIIEIDAYYQLATGQA